MKPGSHRVDGTGKVVHITRTMTTIIYIALGDQNADEIDTQLDSVWSERECRRIELVIQFFGENEASVQGGDPLSFPPSRSASCGAFLFLLLVKWNQRPRS
jgi:hypothetical protein